MNLSPNERKAYREKFADKIGVDLRTLTRYCCAIHDIDTIKMIADALGVTVEDMIAERNRFHK